MSTLPKLALGVAAVIAILLGGAFILRPGPSDNGVGGVPIATPSASPTASPTPTAAPSATPMASATPGALSVGVSALPLAAGTYTVLDPFPVHTRLTIPRGWSGNIGGPYAVFLQRSTGPGSIDLTIFEDVFADPCHSDRGFVSPRPGSSASALAVALARMPNVKPTKAVIGTIGGRSATQLTLTAPTSTTCTPTASEGLFPTWELPLGAVEGIGPGQQVRVSILDVDGTRLVIDAQEPVVQDAALHAEIQSILDSIQIQPSGS